MTPAPVSRAALLAACLAWPATAFAQAGLLAKSNPVLNPGGSLWNAAGLAAAVSFWPQSGAQPFSVWGGMLSNALPVPKSLSFTSPAPLAAAFRAARAGLPDCIFTPFQKPAQAEPAAKAAPAPSSLPMPERAPGTRSSPGPAAGSPGQSSAATGTLAERPTGERSAASPARSRIAREIAASGDSPDGARPEPGKPVRGALQTFTAELRPEGKRPGAGLDLHGSMSRMSRLFDGNSR